MVENRSKKSRPSFSKNNHRYITDVDTDPHYSQSQNISQEELKRDRFFFNMISSYQQSRRHESSEDKSETEYEVEYESNEK